MKAEKLKDKYVAEEVVSAWDEMGKKGCNYDRLLKGLVYLLVRCSEKMDTSVRAAILNASSRMFYLERRKV